MVGKEGNTRLMFQGYLNLNLAEITECKAKKLVLN